MAQTKQTKQTNAVTANAATPTTATVRKPARKPPVIDRVGVNEMDIATPAAPTSATASTGASATAGASSSGSTATSAPSSTGSTASTASSTGSGVDFPVNSPPVVVVPAVPNGFVPVSGVDLRGFRPMQSELASVPDAILELQGFTNYTALFGVTAPPAAQVIARLAVAAQWTSLLSSSTAWYTYVKSQEGMAWKDALELVEKLKAPFQLASASNPALLSQYPALARMLAAKQVVAKRASSTKAKNKKAAATAAQTAAAAPAPAQPATTEASPAPTRVVTVQG